ncbi:MAG: hypothetical protein ISS77_07470 [Phycisphaerae bacterium]|nr:hypothetical protein [Phycisphaerae bacterium]
MSHSKDTLVHVTHEAVCKVGGIGAVLQGFFTSQPYLDAVGRSILVGPIFDLNQAGSQRLGDEGEVFYSSLDGICNSKYNQEFEMIESFFGTNIVYGSKRFFDDRTGVGSDVEVLLINPFRAYEGHVDHFKKRMYEQFGIESDRYEKIWECEQYVRIAPVAIAALKEIGVSGEKSMIIAHEFMGMPAVLAAKLDCTAEFRTAFYAHEVATMRLLTEKNPGHDTMFYNSLERGLERGVCVNEVFGDQSWYFKHAYVDAAKYCDVICAVGDYVSQELRFMGAEFENSNINIVYNGIPSYQISVEEKISSRNRLKQYCENLLGYRPDSIFTHVTRLVTSKGLWRDLEILKHIDKRFGDTGQSGVYFLLSTQVSQRPTADILGMEKEYGWPVAHRESWPDLSGGEAEFYTKVQQFNAVSRNIKAVFINQFGFDRSRCGVRMPEDMCEMDIRSGSDVEFGLSIYEPFGIAQLEPLTFGGLCVITNVCGCAGFVKRVTGGREFENILIADYTKIDHEAAVSFERAIEIGRDQREEVEEAVSAELSSKICSLLTEDRDAIAERIQNGYQVANEMSWDAVIENYVLKALGVRKTHRAVTKDFSLSIN